MSRSSHNREQDEMYKRRGAREIHKVDKRVHRLDVELIPATHNKTHKCRKALITKNRTKCTKEVVPVKSTRSINACIVLMLNSSLQPTTKHINVGRLS